jgi:hypothetical protein
MSTRERVAMGHDGPNAAEILYNTIDEDGNRALPAPTGAALKAETIDKVDAAIAAAGANVDETLTELSQAVSEKFGEVDGKLTDVDLQVAAKLGEADAKIDAVEAVRVATDQVRGQAAAVVADAATIVGNVPLSQNARIGAELAAASVTGSVEAIAQAGAVTAGYAGAKVVVGNAPAAGTTNIADGTVRFLGVGAQAQLPIAQILAWCTAVGDGGARLIVAAESPGGKWDIIVNEPITGVPTTGAVTLKAGEHFPAGIVVPVGGRIGIYRAAGNANFGAAVGVAGDSLTNTGQPAGVAQTLTSGSTKPLFQVALQDVVAVATDVAAARAGSQPAAAAVEEAAYGDAPVAGGNFASANHWGTGEVFAFAADFVGIEYYGGTTPGAAFVDIYRPNGGGTWRRIARRAVTLVTGLATARFDTPVAVLPGDQYVLAPKTGFVQYSNKTAGFGGVNVSNASQSAAVLVAHSTIRPEMRPILQTAVTQRDAYADQLRKSTTITRTTFAGTATPAGWTLGANMAINGKLTATSPSQYRYAVHDRFSAAGRRTLTAAFQMVSVASKVGICTIPMGNNFAFGVVASIDATAGAGAAVLRLEPWTSIAGVFQQAGPGTSIAIPWTVVAGDIYVMTLRKRLGRTIAAVSHSLTGQQVTLEGYWGQLDPVGRMWGKPGAIFLAGNAECLSFHAQTDVQRDCHWLWISDSNYEGNSPLGANSRFAPPNQLSRIRGKGDTLNMSRGGDRTDYFLAERLQSDLLAFAPKYVVLNLGTNETDAAVWRTNTATIIGHILSTGAMPVLGTLLPATGQTAKNTAINADIRNRYFGDYPFFDVARALSANNDDGDWNPAYKYDAPHANIAGLNLATQVIRQQLPFLTDE